MADYELEFNHIKQAINDRYRGQKSALYWLNRGPKVSSQDQIEAVESELNFLISLIVKMEKVK